MFFANIRIKVANFFLRKYSKRSIFDFFYKSIIHPFAVADPFKISIYA